MLWDTPPRLRSSTWKLETKITLRRARKNSYDIIRIYLNIEWEWPRYNSYRWNNFVTALSAAFPQISRRILFSVCSFEGLLATFSVHCYERHKWNRSGHFACSEGVGPSYLQFTLYVTCFCDEFRALILWQLGSEAARTILISWHGTGFNSSRYLLQSLCVWNIQ